MQDRTGADEASVPLDDITAIKDAHDHLQEAAAFAFEEAINVIDASVVSAAIRSQLPDGQATRERFVGILLPSIIAVSNPRRVLDRTRAVLALAPWHSSAPTTAVAGADAVTKKASLSAVDDVRSASTSTAAHTAGQQHSRKKRSAPRLPKKSLPSAKHGTPGYMRPLVTDATRARGGEGTRQARAWQF